MFLRGEAFVILLSLASLSRAEEVLRPWESQGLWAPSAALAYADTALADKAEALFSNPAGLQQIRFPSLRYSHRPFSLDPNYDDLVYAQPFGHGASLGLGFNSTRANGSGSQEAVLGAAFNMAGAAAGLSLRRGDRSLSFRDSGASYSGDLGLLWKNAAGKLQVGGALRRLPFNTIEDGEPHIVSLGAAFNFDGWRASVDGKLAAGQHSLQGGLELPLFDVLDLRLGLSSVGYQGAALGLSGGLGLHYGQNLTLDYGAYPTRDQGVLHSLSVGYSFSQGGEGWVDEAAREARLRRAEERSRRREQQRADAMKKVDTEKDSAAAGFPLEASVSGRHVILEWQAPPGGPWSYVVTQGLLENAKFRDLGQAQEKTQWAGELSLQGVTYYFRVLSQGADGSAGPRSELKAVRIP